MSPCHCTNRSCCPNPGPVSSILHPSCILCSKYYCDAYRDECHCTAINLAGWPALYIDLRYRSGHRSTPHAPRLEPRGKCGQKRFTLRCTPLMPEICAGFTEPRSYRTPCFYSVAHAHMCAIGTCHGRGSAAPGACIGPWADAAEARVGSLRSGGQTSAMMQCAVRGQQPESRAMWTPRSSRVRPNSGPQGVPYNEPSPTVIPGRDIVIFANISSSSSAFSTSILHFYIPPCRPNPRPSSSPTSPPPPRRPPRATGRISRSRGRRASTRRLRGRGAQG
jgi:hypothetical protein